LQLCKQPLLHHNSGGALLSARYCRKSASGRTRASADSAYVASQPCCTHMMRPSCALCRDKGSASCVASRILCTSRRAQSAQMK
jgi:hypothetical protein